MIKRVPYKAKESRILLVIIALSVIMIILRFLLNEKGRTSPDSLRFMRTAHVFPEIDNTTTPLGYPLSIKFFTLFGLDEFWASKVVGLLAFLFLIIFAKKENFYFKEIVCVGALFSFISLFAATLSEGLFLAVIFIFLYISRNTILGKLPYAKAIISLSLLLILLYTIRYSALFFIGGCFTYGFLRIKNPKGKIFLYASLLALTYVVLYKFLFIDVYNETYVKQFLEIGLHPTTQLLKELLMGLGTSFNPLIHIANPGGGILNVGIYGLGWLNLCFIILIFLKNKLSETEKFIVYIGVFGMICSFFIQYFYSIDALDYRLLSPFTFPIWLVYFKKLYLVLGKYLYIFPFIAFVVGFAFMWLSKGNYLENRKAISTFLETEKLMQGRIYFYTPNEENLENMKIAELISTVNPNVKITFNPKDTLRSRTLTFNKVLRKVELKKNKFQ